MKNCLFNYSKWSKLFLFIMLLLPLSLANAYNWPWDQGHDCVTGKDGYGKWGYDGTWKGSYTTKECCQLYCKACPVYANTGRLQESYTDLTVPGVGTLLAVTRTYDSQEWASGLMGYGWVSNFDKRLIISRNRAGEKTLVVNLATGEKNFYTEYADGTIERRTKYGAKFKLLKNLNNTYSILQRDGTRTDLRSDGKISKIVDRNSNELIFTYDAEGCLIRITNTSGNYVDLLKGPNGKIASISDNFGRTVNYGYDDNGNLTSVTDPLGYTETYSYNANNLLVQRTDKRGVVVESLTYDNHQPSRVATFVEKGEQYTMQYFNGYTEKSDTKGNKWTYYYNDVGVIQRVIGPLGQEVNRDLNKVTATSVGWEEDANGNRTSYTYDALGKVTSQTDAVDNTLNYTYVVGTDQIETETNSAGTVTKHQYDASGNRTMITYDFGGTLENSVTSTFDAAGNKTSITDSLGRTMTYAYDTNGNLLRITDALENVTTYTYDNRGNRLTEIDGKNNKTTYTYDLMNRLASVTDVLGNTTAYAYDANGNRISEIDANGNTKTLTYDTYNRLIQETDSLSNTIVYTYDSRDNRTSMTDANSNTTTYTYDIVNRMIRKTNALGGQTNYTHDANGNILTTMDANGNTTIFTYDANNRKISEKNVAGETTSYSYDASGNQIIQTLPNGNTITRTYDSLNHITNISDTLGQIKSYTYNLAGLLLTTTDALGNTISYSYDANNRLIQQTDPRGYKMSYTYDVVGNLVTTTDREGNIRSYVYDALRRRVAEADQLGNSTTFSFGKVGNLSSITDTKGNVTAYSYDKANRLIQETYADGTKRNHAYDANGNVINRTVQNGYTIVYTYDALNRKTKIDYPSSNDNNYTYDAVGNLLTANNQDATISLSYDNTYRLIQSVQNGQTVNYSYDIPNGIYTTNYPGGKVVKEVRNVRALLTHVENALSQAIVQYKYDVANRVQTKSYLNGVTANFINNVNGWITDIDYNDGTSQILGFQYGYDNEGNRQYAKKLHDISNSEQYIYDAKYRLDQFKRGTLDTNNEISVPATQTAYNLDALSNWISKTTDGVTENRTHNNMNEIIAINGVSLAYDNNGNLVDDEINTYEYDYENHLIKVIRKSDSTILGEYKYDALGRKISKQTLGISIVYYYDNYRIIEEQIGGFTEATYVYGNEIDEVITMERGEQIYYYHTNSLGSVVAITDTQGNIVEQYYYGVYGKPNIVSSAFGNPYLFTGRRWDEEIGLYYYRVRQYGQKIGRFLQRDPLGYIDGMNLYEYAASNPSNRVDSLGLTSIGSILRAFFWPWDTGEKLWVMGESDSYTRIVRAWAPVQGNIAQLKQAVASNPSDWEQNHRTSPGWVPTKSYSPDPNNGWNVLVASPPGTDPATARKNFIIFVLTGYATNELHTSAIGSFRIIATADEIDVNGCQVKLNIWMYNEMSRRSFGKFANHPLFSWRPMRSQFMWWNWKEKFAFDSNGRVIDIPSNSGNW